METTVGRGRGWGGGCCGGGGNSGVTAGNQELKPEERDYVYLSPKQRKTEKGWGWQEWTKNNQQGDNHQDEPKAGHASL